MEEIFANSQINGEKIVEQLNHYNNLVLDSCTKIANLNQKSMAKYTQMGMEHIHDAMHITDFTSMQNYLTRQANLMHELGNNVTNDVRELVSIGEKISDDWQEIVRASFAD